MQYCNTSGMESPCHNSLWKMFEDLCPDSLSPLTPMMSLTLFIVHYLFAFTGVVADETFIAM